ncbi:methyl-accepting chemotaxis protein [Catenovulum maritimum]|uniref:Chemotaxis protein n=1 Tax=Catenovulum maritimum TaxID=1513271 RepID=A0A0J8GTP5_9ALTE|nr:methyl-accepting chemotaxis protein [Catenovulum maritimum]KMT66135.1 hypothetical protein XM47_05005 [Catenovulum maritimum]
MIENSPAKSSLSLAMKIYLIPLIGAIGFLIYVLLTYGKASSNVSILEEVRDVHFPSLQLTKDNLFRLEKIKDKLSSAVTTGDEDTILSADKSAEEFKQSISKLGTFNNAFRADATAFTKNFDAYYTGARTISYEMVNNTADFSTLAQRAEKVNKIYDELAASMQNFESKREENFRLAIDDSSNTASALITIGIFMFVVVTVLLAVPSILISNSIKKNLTKVINSLRNIAEENGDLTVRIKVKRNDEIGQLVFWFNSFMDQLQDVIRKVVNTSLPLAELANQLQSLADQTNDTVLKQKQSASETKHSVEDMQISVKDVAESAANAADSTNQATQAATKGKEVVDLTVRKIQQMSDNSTQTASVIEQLKQDCEQVGVVLDVIRSIAEQTNLLALNAAIEAARAGEQGRGFAVVADEVRTLASRTQESTKQINETIEQLHNASNSAVQAMAIGTETAQECVDTANQAGESLFSINQTIHQISEMNSHIAETTEQQSVLADKIVHHTDDIYQKTSETEQSSASLAQVSNELADLAAQLKATSGMFKV